MNTYIKIGTKIRVNALSLIGLVPLVLINGAECVFIITLSAFFHELAHVAAIKAGRGEIKRTDIDFLSAEIVYSSEKMSFRAEMINSLAGITVNIILALSFYFLYGYYPDIRFAFFALCNASLAFVNLLPVRGLDGYNAAYYALQLRYDANRAYEICCKISKSASIFLVSSVFFIVIETGFNTSVLLLIMLAAVLGKQAFMKT